MEALNALGINLGFLLVYIIGFLILLLVLRAWVYGPILNLLDKRRATISQGLEDARVASEARANAEKDAAKVREEAQRKASETVREASERAESAARDIRAAADAEAARILEAARAEGESQKERMLADLRPQVVALAMSAAQKVIGEALDEKRQHSLLEQFFSGVKAGSVTVLEGASVSGATAEVTSALPLTDAEKEAVRKDVLAKAGAATVNFKVDPNILGGLVVKVGDRVLDGSVAGQLSSLRESLS